SIYDLVLGAIGRCVDEGVIERDTSMTTNDIAHVFWALIHGLVTLSLQDVSIARQNIVHTALETFLSGLSGERATRKQKDDEL
ncbi:MAG: WHG domain-containing protein, partial [Caldilineaceae bacterium]|nr:WHG domain-containing protein [Caldilineaceae bacterium]